MRNLQRFAMIALILLITSAPLMVSFAEAGSYAYTRSCTASFMITNARRNMVTVHYGQFTASSTLHQYLPNTIRAFASRKAAACISAGWAARYSDTPEVCTEDYDIYGYPSGLIAYHIGREVCSRWGGYEPGMSVYVNVYAEISGDKGCGGGNSTHTIVPIAHDAELTCR